MSSKKENKVKFIATFGRKRESMIMLLNAMFKEKIDDFMYLNEIPEIYSNIDKLVLLVLIKNKVVSVIINLNFDTKLFLGYIDLNRLTKHYIKGNSKFKNKKISKIYQLNIIFGKNIRERKENIYFFNEITQERFTNDIVIKNYYIDEETLK